MTKQQRQNNLLPNGVPKYVRCYDAAGKHEAGQQPAFDQFTVVFTGRYRNHHGNNFHGRPGQFEYVAMSAFPFHPQGIGQHGSSDRQIDVNPSGFAPAMGRRCHLGKRIPFSELPPDCRKLVLRDYKEIWNLAA